MRNLFNNVRIPFGRWTVQGYDAETGAAIDYLPPFKVRILTKFGADLYARNMNQGTHSPSHRKIVYRAIRIVLD